jgi:hypothetical protein
MISWSHGIFELTPEDPRKFEPPLDLNVQEVLMEGFRQKDELANLASKLPPFEAKLSLAAPLTPKLRDLSPEQLDLLQTVLNSKSATISGILDHSPLDDLKTVQALGELIQKAYVSAG